MQQNSDSQNSEPELNCPSFNAYSTSTLSADKATSLADDDNSDFEFTSPAELPDQIFPLFNRNLLADNDSAVLSGRDVRVDYRNRNELSCDRTPLEKLFLDDCSSSEEEDELESVPPETYCVWRPQTASPSCEKSSSTGTSASERVVRKWRLRDLMRRSKSDGQESFVFLKREKAEERESENAVVEKKKKEKSFKGDEMFSYVKKNNSETRKKSYLPYRPELVGFFGTSYGSVRMA